MTVKSEFLKTMKERGFFHQCTNESALDKALCEGTVTAYTGFDATAKSLHVGNLMPITLLRWLQKTGHKPIVLMGGGTTKLGDPSGKDDARKLLSTEEINENISGIKKAFEKYLTFGDGKTDAIMVNNADWLEQLNYIDFLRDYGRHFSVNRMLAMDSVKQRIDREQSISFLEFSYMIMQGYDFLELNRTYGCTLQMSGSDQWGNIVQGVELSRRVDSKEVFGFTCPLLLNSEGKKMGKSVDGAIWLNADMRSPYDFYQYFRNADDADVSNLLRFFTELPMDEIAKLEALQGAEINEAKKVLAFETTKLCHGEQTATEVAETARKTFEEGASAAGLPTITLPRGKLSEGIPAFVLFKEAGLVSSGGEARRLISGGGARVNDEKVTDGEQVINLDNFTADNTIKLSAGKKKHALIVIGE